MVEQEQVVAGTQDTQIPDEMEGSQSSAGNSSQSSNSRFATPPPLTPSRRPTPGKRMCNGPKMVLKTKLLQIIEKMKCFVLVYLPL